MHVFIQAAAPWLDEYVKSFIQSHVPDAIFVDEVDQLPKDPAAPTFQICDGSNLNPHFSILNASESSLMNAYPNSDALARKDCLGRVVEYWAAKRPDSILRKHVPQTVQLSLDYSEYVDDSLASADDLTLLYSLEENADKDSSEREWWILKPALIDCADGIRIFSTMDELASCLELAANVEDDSDHDVDEDGHDDLDDGLDDGSVSGLATIGQSYGPEESEVDGDSDLDLTPASVSVSVSVDQSSESEQTTGPTSISGEDEQNCETPAYLSPSQSDPFLSSLDAAIGKVTIDDSLAKARDNGPERLEVDENGRIMSARIREFVAQRYIISVPPVENKKWHVRAYVLSMGRLKVYVFRELFALLAVEDYAPPWENPSLRSSLTNTSLQDEDEFVANDSMRAMSDLPEDLLPGDWKTRVFDQICAISMELFQAAAYTMADKFTPLDKCFELYALDFLIDTAGIAWLLEVNETPAFYEYGYAGELAVRLMESLVCVALEPMGKAQNADEPHARARERMVLVLDETEKLGKSNITQILPEK